MGFIKDLGEVVGNVAGSVLGGGVQFIGGAVDSDFIKEVGDGVRQSTKNTGKILGQAAEGTYKTVKGVITQDKEELKSGIKDIGGAAGKTALGVGRGMGNLVVTSHDIIDSVVIGDNEEAKKSLSKLAKGVAIGAIGIGVLDGLDVIGDDGVNFNSDGFFDNDDNDTNFINEDTNNEFVSESRVDSHHVDSYTRADGTFVSDYWRDGDGDTSVDLTVEDGGGYLRTNFNDNNIFDNNDSDTSFVNDDVNNEFMSKRNIDNNIDSNTNVDVALENASDYLKSIFNDNDKDTGVINMDANSEDISVSHVDPHHVNSYTTADGIIVSDYWRDGDGDTNVDLTLKDGGGFLRNNS